MKIGQTVKFKYANSGAKIIGQEGSMFKVMKPTGETSLEPPSTIELVTIVLEVFSFFKDLFTTKIPLEIKVGDRNYCLNLRYDHFEQMVFAYYRDELKKETLIGEAYGKNTSSAKKKIKDKLKKAGYL